MEKHRSSYKYWKEGKCGKTNSFILFEKYGVENCNIILLEYINAQSKDELTAKEAEYIKNYKCINKLLPFQTNEERKEKNKDKNKTYRLQNKDKIQKIKKEYYQDNKDKFKEYYDKNKDKINAIKKTHYICDICNGNYTYNHRSKHFNTQKHQTALNNND
jgi:hypothetical protein